MTYKETTVRGGVNTEHLVQLFDGPESRADAVAAFTKEGLEEGDSVLVVITREHWDAVARRLRSNRVQLKKAAESGQLTVRDAAATLERFMRDGLPDPDLFDELIGTMVRELASNGRPLRIYGEMVDLLAAEGDFRSTLLLEEYWNKLGEQLSMTLFCGYHAVNFGDPRSSGMLSRICRSHSLVRSNPRDLLGSFLLDSAAVQAATASDAAR